MTFLKNHDWGLRLLALVLAIVIYQALKDRSSDPDGHKNDRTFFQSR